MDVDAANSLLASVGFLLVPGRPMAQGAAYLMIALRPRPTLAHFDPERIEYWSTDRDRPARGTLEWPMTQIDGRYTWGLITTTDRLIERNQFASFGGRLTTARDGDRHAAIFRSEAPIVSVGGHSVPGDPLGVRVAGFFGTLRGAAGDRETERLIEAAGAIALYAVFLVRTLATFQVQSTAGAASPRVAALLRSEIRRLERESPADLQAALDIERLV
jgi:hypothetical protein